MACKNTKCHLWQQCQENNCVCDDEVANIDHEDFKDGYP